PDGAVQRRNRSLRVGRPGGARGQLASAPPAARGDAPQPGARPSGGAAAPRGPRRVSQGRGRGAAARARRGARAHATRWRAGAGRAPRASGAGGRGEVPGIEAPWAAVIYAIVALGEGSFGSG